MRFLFIFSTMTFLSPILAAPSQPRPPSHTIYYVKPSDPAKETQFLADVATTIKLLETVIEALSVPEVEKSSAVHGLIGSITSAETLEIAKTRFQPLLTALKGNSAQVQGSSSSQSPARGLIRIDNQNDYTSKPKTILIVFPSTALSPGVYSTSTSTGNGGINIIKLYPKAFETKWETVEKAKSYSSGFPLPLNLILEAQITSLAPPGSKDLSLSGRPLQKLIGSRELWSDSDLMRLPDEDKRWNAQNYAVQAFWALVHPEKFRDDHTNRSPTPPPPNPAVH